MSNTAGMIEGSSSGLDPVQPLLVNRVQYHRYGGAEELHIEEVALSGPGRGHVRVQVRAAAANPMDWKIRSGEMRMITGRRFPRGLGHDFAGVVEAVGPDAARFKVGDEVFGATTVKASGTFAEAVVVAERTVFAKPPSLSFEEAAALPVVSAAAWTGLIDQAKLRPGQRVLISGCLGGVGRAAAQIAKMRGALVTGSCRASGRAEALALGVHEVVDYRAFDPNPFRGRFDVVFDTHGSLSLQKCAVMLKRGGLALHVVPTPWKMLRSGVSPRHLPVFAKITPQCMASIIEAVEQGDFSPKIGRIVPLSAAIRAIIDLEKNGLPEGKLLISPMQ